MKNGIVIPCYNEAKRLQFDAFQNFTETHEDYVLCFVNDGSKDNTLELLNAFQSENPDRVRVYDMPQNGGKAEAVRAGTLHLIAKEDVENVGFMDADLSTSFEDYMELVEELKAGNGKNKMVFGSRKALDDGDIKRSFFRSVASDIVGVMIRSILRLPIQDTQCGAKVFDARLAQSCFRSGFVTRWLFDVELFIRARKEYGRKRLMKMIVEKPLNAWVEVEGSKLTLERILCKFRVS